MFPLLVTRTQDFMLRALSPVGLRQILNRCPGRRHLACFEDASALLSQPRDIGTRPWLIAHADTCDVPDNPLQFIFGRIDAGLKAQVFWLILKNHAAICAPSPKPLHNTHDPPPETEVDGQLIRCG